jgi:hypothetical protein
MALLNRLLDRPSVKWYDPFFPITIVLGITLVGYC